MPEKTFGGWVINRTYVLFLPKRDPYYPLSEIIHFFAKRLSLSDERTMLMDEEKRDEIFKIEKAILDAEVKNKNMNRGKTESIS